MIDLIIHGVNLPDGRSNCDIDIVNVSIEKIYPEIDTTDKEEIQAVG